jgi:trehalose-phosphatase
MSELRTRLEALARAPILLVATDYDGVLAPIVNDPSKALPAPGAVEALRALLEIPQTVVAVITGRGLETIRKLLGPIDGITLVGSYGAEDDRHAVPPSSADIIDALNAVKLEAKFIEEADPGFRLEDKPTGIALHYRQATPLVAEALTGYFEAAARARQGLHLLNGKMVLEVTRIPADKGAALRALRSRHGAAATLYAGDCIADESAFAALSATDLGIRVGAGESIAHHRLPSPDAFIETLRNLAALRKQIFAEQTAVPITDHSVLSDQRTLCVVTPGARITWLCLPRVDSSAIFAELLGGPTAGFWSIAPVGSTTRPTQTCEPDSFVLKTAWPELTVTDYLDCSGGRPFQRAGRSDLVRIVEGNGQAEIRFAPRADFGRLRTRLRIVPDGLELEGTQDPIVLFSPGVAWRIESQDGHDTAIAMIDLAKDRPVTLELRYGAAAMKPATLPETQRRTQTARFWQSWASSLQLPDLARDEVKRSALFLKSLTHGPTGALVAAATTSLPETPGGIRNWDYRFCWPRDAAISAAALLRLGNTGHAMRFLDWMLSVVDELGSAERLRPVHTVMGRDLAPEAEISSLSGYSLSKPVRINNAASLQLQLDVFGPIVDVAAMLAAKGAPLSPEHWRLVESMVTAVQARWHEPDHGIWEIRDERRHHVHSKAMCWLAVDRAIALRLAYLGQTSEPWEILRAEIAKDVLERGWNPRVRAYTASYGSDNLDASVLLIALIGLLSPSDPRFVSTVAAIERELREGPTVYRYRYDDGLPGIEGGFHICTEWLIESYAMMGRRDDAHALFRDLLALAGPTGVLSEQYCPRRRLALGNMPQAYSHAAIINAAVMLDAMDKGVPPHPVVPESSAPNARAPIHPRAH